MCLKLTKGAPRNAMSNATYFSFVRHWSLCHNLLGSDRVHRAFMAQPPQRLVLTNPAPARIVNWHKSIARRRADDPPSLHNFAYTSREAECIQPFKNLLCSNRVRNAITARQCLFAHKPRSSALSAQVLSFPGCVTERRILASFLVPHIARNSSCGLSRTGRR